MHSPTEVKNVHHPGEIPSLLVDKRSSKYFLEDQYVVIDSGLEEIPEIILMLTQAGATIESELTPHTNLWVTDVFYDDKSMSKSTDLVTSTYIRKCQKAGKKLDIGRKDSPTQPSDELPKFFDPTKKAKPNLAHKKPIVLSSDLCSHVAPQKPAVSTIVIPSTPFNRIFGNKADCKAAFPHDGSFFYKTVIKLSRPRHPAKSSSTYVLWTMQKTDILAPFLRLSRDNFQDCIVISKWSSLASKRMIYTN
jgi:hypothetical protein